MAAELRIKQEANMHPQNKNSEESAQEHMKRVDTYRSELEKRWGPREPLTEDQQDKFETEFHNAMRMRRWPADHQAEQKTRLDNRWSNIYKKILGIITNLLKLIK